MKYLWLLIPLLLLATGCQKDIPSSPEAYTCTQDSDCVMQSTSCNNCNCPKAINKDYQVPLRCKNSINQPYCDLYCNPSRPVCLDNICTTKEIERANNT
jgi:hypothetical protein